MNTRQKQYTIEALKNQVSRYHYYLRVAECALEHLPQYVNQVITKRELNKLLSEIQKAYPETTLFFKVEKWGREAIFSCRIDGDYLRQNVSIESLTSDRRYTNYLKENSEIQVKNYRENLASSQAQLNNIHELIALTEKQEQEREELQKRQELERETFIAQTKCGSADISCYIKQAEERRREEERNAHFKKQEAEFEKRMEILESKEATI